MRNRFFCTVLLYGLSCMFVRAVGEGGHAFAEVKDSIKPDADSVSSVVEPVRKTRNPLKWIGRYLSNTNKHEDRPFDFSMLIGPSYSCLLYTSRSRKEGYANRRSREGFFGIVIGRLMK